MTNNYVSVFGGSFIFPSDVTYLALALTADTTLQWALEANTGFDVVARIIDVTPTGAYAITMPPANETAPGQLVQFFNAGASTITVKDNDGGVLLTITAGLTFVLYLTDNSDAAGTWRSTQLGATTAQAQASALAGFGLTVTGSTLSQSQPTTTFNANYATAAADRSQLLVWTGGLGTLTLPTAASLGNNWFISVRNAGAGNLTVACSGGDTINGATNLILRPGDSATVNTDGATFYTVGLGQNPVFAFNFATIDLTGAGATYVLSGSELNQIAYEFIGVLANDVKVVIPSTTQQYWLSNATTGAFTLTAGTATQGSPVTLTAAQRGIYYCQGTVLVNADTQNFASPIAIADGGTGATTASAARVNLGGTATGIAVFTAASAAAARSATGAASSGANTDITSLTGLTGLCVVNLSGGAAPTAATGTGLQTVGAAGVQTYALIDTFQAFGAFVGRYANGTPGAPSAVLSGNTLSGVTGRGYMATGYSTAYRGGVFFQATENWTDAANGTQISFHTTTNTTTAPTARWAILNSGHLQPSATNTYDLGTSASSVRSGYFGTSLIVNTSGAAAPTAAAGTGLQIVGPAGGGTAREQINSFAAAAVLALQRADGIPGAPTAVQLDESIGGVLAQGYGATAYGGTTAAVIFRAAENYTDAAQGTSIFFQTTTVGGTTLTSRWQVRDFGHLWPAANGTYDVGDASFRVRRVYTSSYSSQTPKTVASLTAAAAAGAGARDFVSDATATTFASIVAGGGANNVPVYSDGTNWRIG